MEYFKTNQIFAPIIQKETPTNRYFNISHTYPHYYSFEEIGEFTCTFNFKAWNIYTQSFYSTWHTLVVSTFNFSFRNFFVFCQTCKFSSKACR